MAEATNGHAIVEHGRDYPRQGRGDSYGRWGTHRLKAMRSLERVRLIRVVGPERTENGEQWLARYVVTLVSAEEDALNVERMRATQPELQTMTRESWKEGWRRTPEEIEREQQAMEDAWLAEQERSVTA